MNCFNDRSLAANRRVWACAAVVIVAVVTVLVWVATMDGDPGQTASMLGASIAVTVAAASGRRSCRPAFLFEGRRSSER